VSVPGAVAGVDAGIGVSACVAVATIAGE